MKIPKREIAKQRELYNKILTGTTFTDDFIDQVYEEFNPAIVDNLSENGVYFTPPDLAFDAMLFAPRRGHILDLCSGIGMLSYALKIRDNYDKSIQSITAIEYNPKFVEIGKRILPDVRWINGDAYSKDLLDSLVKDLPDKRFDLIVSNPPFGHDMNDKAKYDWLNFTGQRDLMAVEIALRYAKNGYFILPIGSVPFKYSGRSYYEHKPDRYSRKLVKFFKDNKEFDFNMTCDGIDCDVYRDQWKNLNGGISVECVNMDIHPYSLWCVEDSITYTLKKPDAGK